MVAITLSTLPPPPKGWRPGRDTRRPDGKTGFEKISDCLTEDKERAGSVKKMADTPDVNLEDAAYLSRRLLDGVKEKSPPETLASKLYFRERRRRIFGWLWYLIENQKPRLPVEHVTLIPRSPWVKADELHTLSPAIWKERLRGDLKRIGATARKFKGFIFAGLDAEFHADLQEYCLHYHLIVVGMRRIQKVDKLRKTRKYRRSGVRGAAPAVRKPIKRSEMPDRLTYVLKSFWKEIPKIPQPDGSTKRGIDRRISEPNHSNWLLWIDRQRVEDMTLMIGIRASRQGIVLTRKDT